jgi:DNA-binding CsgD family transcriptional regulator
MRGLANLVNKTSSVRHTNIDIPNAISAQGRSLKSKADRPTYDLLMAGLEALDLVNVALAVTNAEGNLLFANHTAEHVFECRDGLELTARKTIRTSRRSGHALEDLIRQAGRSAREGAADSILAIPRSSGKRPLTLLIRSVDIGSGNRDALAPAVLVFILDPEVPIGTAETELRQLYGLTSTEACLASLLMEGKTLDDCCRLLDIRRSTARTHLQHLFEKVGVQRQSELVSLLLKSIGLVRIGRKAPKGRASVANSDAGSPE